jgi:hypothetical protein
MGWFSNFIRYGINIAGGNLLSGFLEIFIIKMDAPYE